MLKRRGELIDKKYSVGLTKKETKELNDINKKLDEEDEVGYDPVIEQLEKVLEKAINLEQTLIRRLKEKGIEVCDE